MTEPITTAVILGLAAQKFAEGAAGKTTVKLATIAEAKGEDAT